ncbi:hypothetical protein ACL7TT_16540 [Microbulbifer sp. 2304DJ12-6]|uniref:hypothetical protein n=1 Tax=Microbulbifer sp. 2304DJ12-6 TaxID=3233340 RepID=UPI0039AF40A5
MNNSVLSCKMTELLYKFIAYIAVGGALLILYIMLAIYLFNLAIGHQVEIIVDLFENPAIYVLLAIMTANLIIDIWLFKNLVSVEIDSTDVILLDHKQENNIKYLCEFRVLNFTFCLIEVNDSVKAWIPKGRYSAFDFWFLPIFFRREPKNESVKRFISCLS